MSVKKIVELLREEDRDMSVAEIAQALNYTEETVKRDLRREEGKEQLCFYRKNVGLVEWGDDGSYDDDGYDEWELEEEEGMTSLDSAIELLDQYGASLPELVFQRESYVHPKVLAAAREVFEAAEAGNSPDQPGNMNIVRTKRGQIGLVNVPKPAPGDTMDFEGASFAQLCGCSWCWKEL